MTFKERARKLKQDVPAVFLALKDHDTPLIALTVKLIPKKVWVRCQAESENMWKDGKPKKWYFAIPVILMWLLIVWLIIKAIWL